MGRELYFYIEFLMVESAGVYKNEPMCVYVYVAAYTRETSAKLILTDYEVIALVQRNYLRHRELDKK